jgi:hypothetical protein
MFPNIFGAGASGGGRGGVDVGAVELGEAGQQQTQADRLLLDEATDEGSVMSNSSLGTGGGNESLLSVGGRGGPGGFGLGPSALSVVVEGLTAEEREQVVEAWLGMDGTVQVTAVVVIMCMCVMWSVLRMSWCHLNKRDPFYDFVACFRKKYIGAIVNFLMSVFFLPSRSRPLFTTLHRHQLRHFLLYQLLRALCRQYKLPFPGCLVLRPSAL